MSYDGSVVDGYSYDSAIDAGARFVAFLSSASNLVPGDTNGRADVFVRDLQQMSTARVSVNSAGVQANGASLQFDVSISGNGRLVAFTSWASNLVAGDTIANCDTNGDTVPNENCPDVFVRDRDKDGDGTFDEPDDGIPPQETSTTLVSVSNAGVQGDGASGSPDISADGRFVAFTSFASNLIPGDNNNLCNGNGGNGSQNCSDVFVRDLLLNSTVRVSVDSGGGEGNQASSEPSISGNGRFVGFTSKASSLAVIDGDPLVFDADVFVRDRDIDADGVFDEPQLVSTVAVSVDVLAQTVSDSSSDSSIARDAAQLTFASGARLVPNDTNSSGNSIDIYSQDFADIDDDDVFGAAEVVCGSDPQDASKRPKRLDGAFAGVSDDGDAEVDEALPPGSDIHDCDGDGWTGTQERAIFSAPATAHDQDPCGNDGWPADLSGNDNTLNVGDIGSFLLPSRPNDGHGAFNRFNHALDDDGDTVIEANEDPPGEPGVQAYNVSRWNLQTPPHLVTTQINIGDIGALITGAVGSSARPPMFGGQPAFFTNGGVCPWPDPLPPPPMGAPDEAAMGGPAAESSTGEPLEGGTASIDQLSIDTGPPGPLRPLVTNGKAAVGDRDGDTVVDAEGYDTPDPGDAPGVCGNGLDDDRGDSDGDTVPDGPLDGVADDGCQLPLTPRETCINIIDDGIKNADEDAVVSGQDRAMIDVTVGLPDMIGGIPASRPMSSWQYSLNWDADVLDIRLQQNPFLILADGGASPFTSVASALPDAASPFTAAVSDAGPSEAGPGVLSRVTVEGNGAGLANLTLTGVQVSDSQNEGIPVDLINGAQIAVSKDLDGDGVIEAVGAQGQEAYSCPPP